MVITHLLPSHLTCFPSLSPPLSPPSPLLSSLHPLLPLFLHPLHPPFPPTSLPPLSQSRLAVNSVIVGDFQRPFAIAELLTTISSGFRLLNLKNDALRKRFDGLKYDVSKVEEVVYDLTVRGLKPQSGEKRPAP